MLCVGGKYHTKSPEGEWLAPGCCAPALVWHALFFRGACLCQLHPSRLLSTLQHLFPVVSKKLGIAQFVDFTGFENVTPEAFVASGLASGCCAPALV